MPEQNELSYTPDIPVQEFFDKGVSLYQLRTIIRSTRNINALFNVGTRPPDLKSAKSIRDLFLLLPEWLKDTILSLIDVYEFITSKLIRDGEWTTVRWYNFRSNFLLLVAIIKMLISIFKHFKTDGSEFN